VLLGDGLEALPWEGSVEEIDENICKRFEIVTACMFNT
jgi:hypothetical protein